jgi:hypothetical protein
MFNDTFNNISVISWPSVLLVEETGVLRKGWWTFKIKVRLICLIYFKETFTNEFYLYFESPPSFSKNIMQAEIDCL